MMHTDFLKRLRAIVPEDKIDGIIARFSAILPVTVRANTLTSDMAALKAALDGLGVAYRAVPGFLGVLSILQADKLKLTKSDFYNAGFAYIQSLSSLLPALFLDPKPGEEVLDLCAAPGSKTSQMAAMMNNEGRIAAVEKSRPRFFKLRANLERLGVSCVDTYLKDGSAVWRSCEGRFDKVLVDAPCSSEGRFNMNDPDTLKYWSPNKIKQMARAQWVLLQSGFRSLKPGGMLVYSTCTFAPEENEAIISKLLKRYPDAKILPCAWSGENQQAGLAAWQGRDFHPGITHCVRILPNEQMPGFFVAYIERLAT